MGNARVAVVLASGGLDCFRPLSGGLCSDETVQRRDAATHARGDVDAPIANWQSRAPRLGAVPPASGRRFWEREADVLGVFIGAALASCSRCP